MQLSEAPLAAVPLPQRPGFGKKGTEIALYANHFAVTVNATEFYQYRVDITVRSSTVTGVPSLLCQQRTVQRAQPIRQKIKPSHLYLPPRPAPCAAHAEGALAWRAAESGLH